MSTKPSRIPGSTTNSSRCARLDADRPTLGVCLGTQIVAVALGARVYAGPAREIGFAPVTLHDAAKASPLRHVENVDLLHWHGDTLELPEGTELLASTPAYANQAFRRGDRLLALHFHAEMGEHSQFDAWLGDVSYLLGAGVDPVVLRVDHDRLWAAAVRAGEKMIGEWLAGLN